MEQKKLTLRELQLVELDILLKFDGFCKEHGLNYSLVGGTLLGAIRHKGFIPWDDDVDVAMPRPDYERFYSLLSENGFKLDGCDGVSLIPDRGKDGELPFLKLVNDGYKVNADEALGSGNVWIDIMPIDGYPDTQKKTEKFCKKLNRFRHIMVYNIRGAYKRKKGVMRIAALLFTLYARMYGKARVFKNMNKLIAKHPYESSEYVGVATWGLYGAGERLKKDEFAKFVDVEFEDHTLSAMSNWDAYLTGIYGDYMTPRQWSHGVSASSAEGDAADSQAE